MQEVTLLLVEDDDLDAEIFIRSKHFQKLSNPIIRAHDGREALDLLLNDQVPSPYVILLDLNLPRLNGIEFLMSLRRSEKYNPSVVFVLTSSAADEDIKRAFEHQVAGYIVKHEKPDSVDTFVGFLGKYLSGSKLPAIESWG
jgi:CheY-like chemotaxis protein